MVKKEIGVYHKYISLKIKERYLKKYTNIIKRNDLIKVLNKFNIPNSCTKKFLNEMVEAKLIKIVNKQKIKIL